MLTPRLTNVSRATSGSLCGFHAHQMWAESGPTLCGCLGYEIKMKSSAGIKFTMKPLWGHGDGKTYFSAFARKSFAFL